MSSNLQAMLTTNLFKKRLVVSLETRVFKSNSEVRTVCKADLPDSLHSYHDGILKQFIDVSCSKKLNNYIQPSLHKSSKYSFVVKEDVAKNIVDVILKNVDLKEAAVYEGNPGLGLITLNLLNAGVPEISVFDDSRIQKICFLQIYNKYQSKINLTKINMNVSPKLILTKISKSRKKNVPVIFIGVTKSLFFLRKLPIFFSPNLIEENQWEFYLVVNTFVLNCISSMSPKYFRFLQYCLLNFFFQIQVLEKYPDNSFFPPSEVGAEGDMFLIKLSFKPNIFEEIDKEAFFEYYAFIQILGMATHGCIIPVLEKWIPDCGPYLISKGISMSTQVLDLSFQDSVKLFLILKQYKDFDEFRTYHIEKLIERKLY